MKLKATEYCDKYGIPDVPYVIECLKHGQKVHLAVQAMIKSLQKAECSMF